MRVAYADPPYVGQSKRHYKDHPDYAGEVDHEQLITSLDAYDGWALSCSSPSLRYLLPLCPDDVRIMAWVKPFAIFKPNVNPAYAWEPVLVRPARKQGRDVDTNAGLGVSKYHLAAWVGWCEAGVVLLLAVRGTRHHARGRVH